MEQKRRLLKNNGSPSAPHTNIVKTYSMQSIPKWIRPLIEELILGSDIFTEDFDTPENLLSLAKDILKTIDDNNVMETYHKGGDGL